MKAYLTVFLLLDDLFHPFRKNRRECLPLSIMAEALAVLGAVAGSVQLVEVALKTSDDIYSLLRRAQQADQEIKQHMTSREPFIPFTLLLICCSS